MLELTLNTDLGMALMDLQLDAGAAEVALRASHGVAGPGLKHADAILHALLSEPEAAENDNDARAEYRRQLP